MSIDLVKVGGEMIKAQFKEVVQEAETQMRVRAPVYKGKDKGKGSMVTGATKASIHTEMQSPTKAWIGPTTEYAKYAEEGRGAIRKRHLMRWTDNNGRQHAAYAVGPMEGWHFIRDTKNAIIAKYGGK